MIKGLDVFRDHFSDMSDQYVLIGGVAASITMVENALPFRGTKDLDIVLRLEAEDRSFTGRLWAFIEAGGYEIRQRSDGTGPILFRFAKPTVTSYPAQLEFFSKLPEGISLDEEATITPIPTDEGLTSLSAILLDQHYYAYLCDGVHISDALSYIRADRLIPFKARAWIDLTARKASGEKVDSINIDKHRNDIVSLSVVLTPEMATLPESIAVDMSAFLERLPGETINLNKLGIVTELSEVIVRIKAAFSLP